MFLDDGSELNADLLVGADGIYSTIRGELLGHEKPTYAGYTAWRGIVEYPHSTYSPKEEASSPGAGGRGSVVPGWAAEGCTGLPPATPRKEEDDGPIGSRRTLLGIFSGWHEPVEELIEATSETDIRRDDVYDREPVERWGRGRVTLLGDAAHPMTPNLGQGACQAIEDAVGLAGCLQEEAGVAAALRSYEARRTRRTAAIVRLSRRMGQVGQLEHPLLCRLRDATAKRLPASIQRRQLQMILGYEA